MRMRKKSLAAKLGAVSAVAVLGTVLVGASPAFASATEAVAGTPPTWASGQCYTNSTVKACFQPYGDKIWVLDTASDGYAGNASWENLLRNSSGAWDTRVYRSGNCANHLTANHWGYCNYDFYEDTTTNAFGGQGSGIRVFPWAANAGQTGYAWVRNDG